MWGVTALEIEKFCGEKVEAKPLHERIADLLDESRQLRDEAENFDILRQRKFHRAACLALYEIYEWTSDDRQTWSGQRREARELFGRAAIRSMLVQRGYDRRTHTKAPEFLDGQLKIYADRVDSSPLSGFLELMNAVGNGYLTRGLLVVGAIVEADGDGVIVQFRKARIRVKPSLCPLRLETFLTEVVAAPGSTLEEQFEREIYGRLVPVAVKDRPSGEEYPVRRTRRDRDGTCKGELYVAQVLNTMFYPNMVAMGGEPTIACISSKTCAAILVEKARRIRGISPLLVKEAANLAGVARLIILEAPSGEGDDRMMSIAKSLADAVLGGGVVKWKPPVVKVWGVSSNEVNRSAYCKLLRALTGRPELEIEIVPLAWAISGAESAIESSPE